MIISDLKDYIGTLRESTSYNPRFKTFVIQEGDDGPVLVGYGQEQHEPTNHYKPNLLFDMVNIIKGPLPEYFDDHYLAEVVEEKRIQKFCHKHGFFVDGASVDLNLLRRKIAWLKSRFQVWHAIASGNKGEVELARYINSRQLDSETLSFMGDSPNERAKTQLGYELSIEIDKIRLLSLYNLETKKFQITLAANDLFAVAYFQLANLLTNDLDKDKNRHIKECQDPDCGQLFWALHGHARYCEYCSRQAAWAKNKRRKGANDGR